MLSVNPAKENSVARTLVRFIRKAPLSTVRKRTFAKLEFAGHPSWSTRGRMIGWMAIPNQLDRRFFANSHVEIPSVPFKELRGNTTAESSKEIRARVEQARTVQHARGFYNSRMPVRDIRKICALDDSGERTLEMAVRRMGLSARAHDRI